MSKPKSKKQMQARFAEKFCGECMGDAVQAAIAAGYSETNARKNAYKLLKIPYVLECIAEFNSKINVSVTPEERPRIASAIRIKTFWSDVMNDEDEIMKNRLRASELLAKAAGLFNNDW